MLMINILRKFGKILSKHQKFRIFELTVLMFVGGVLEMCSVSLIIPFVNAVLDTDAFMEKWYAKQMCNMFGVSSPQNLLMMLAFLMAAVYILKNAYLVFEYNVQYRFVYGNMLLMHRRMLINYLARPYEFYLTVDSGEILRVINDDVREAFALLVTLISFFTETIVSMMLVIAIFLISPFVTICMAMGLFSIMLLITAVIKPMQRSAGEVRQKSLAGINKLLIQVIQGIKEIKVTQSEAFFVDSYTRTGRKYVNSIRRNLVVGIIPKSLIEAISMSTLFIVIAIMIYRGGNMESIIPIIAAIAMAAIRLLPAINRMSSALGSIVYYEPTLDKMIENLKDLDGDEGVACEKNKGIISSVNRGIQMEDVCYKYPGAHKNVLNHSYMTINEGQSVGIIGASGAGKTTAVDLILGLLRVNHGRILVDGHDIKSDLSGWYNMIGYIPQSIFLIDDTIMANVAFGYDRKDIDEEKVWRVLREAALDQYVRELPKGLYTEIGERGIRLSGGQRQRLGIARALYRDPQVIIFDEATSALDNDTESAIMESINNLQGQKTMIIIAHRLTTIQNCDCIFKIANGTIQRADLPH